jgi:hypothetical protein
MALPAWQTLALILQEGVDMNRSWLLALLMTAIVLLMGSVVLIGCTDLQGADESETTAMAVATTIQEQTTVPSVASPQPTTAPPTVSLTKVRYEENDPHLEWEGPWIFTGGADDSGGSCRYTEDVASSVTVKFSGTRVTMITATGLAVGEAKLTLDSGTPFLVDCYSAAPIYQREAWSSGDLAAGTHYLKIECNGTCNPASGGTGIYVDAFDVVGTLE